MPLTQTIQNPSATTHNSSKTSPPQASQPHPSKAPPLLHPASLTLLVGDPGTGKSLLAIDLAARLSRATPLPPFQIENRKSKIENPASALLLSLEDSSNTIQARMLSARADLCHLHHLPGTFDLVPPTYGFPKAWLRAQTDPQPSSLITALAERIPTLNNFRLLILDPLPAFLGVYDCSHQGTIRRLLRPLLQLAEERQFAILGISHLAKLNSASSKSPLHRAFGSLAYTALARTVLLLTQDDVTHDPSRRILVPLKNNFGPLTHAYAFTIQNQLSGPSAPGSAGGSPEPAPDRNWPNTLGEPARENGEAQRADTLSPDTPLLQWDDAPLTSHPLLNDHIEITDELPEASQLASAKLLIETMLADGPIPSAALYKAASSVGISRATLTRARSLLNLTLKFDAQKRQWFLSL